MSSAKANPTYQIRPAYKQRVSVAAMKTIIDTVMKEELEGKTYAVDQAQVQTKHISDEIRNRLKALDLPRYKFMVQVVLGEMRLEGVRMGCRTFWDAETDAHATSNYMNDSLFCVATAYGVYLY
uniref:Dynein light chain n=1 Tax=Rhizochromulina marina TaxID=1034831 RepID=A0A7S2S8M8_9STRA|mmetsp:Transcript_26700/g.77699  ORF Transcript_26700/g.77699 Transcript_26700/m.77699 type:complete len:124 (+) Transcript_26700:24-395(+)